MMKVWIILYIAGHAIAVWGPMDNLTIDSCNKTNDITNQMLVSGNDVKFKCVENITAPQIVSSGPNIIYLK